MSVLSHIGRIFKDSPMRRFFRSRPKTTTKGGAEAAEDGRVQVHEEEKDLDGSKLTWFDAVKEQRMSKVKEYIAEGVNVNETDELGWSALHIATWNNYEDICEQLLAAGADVNLPGPGNSSPLSLASQRGHAAIVKLLLRSNSDVMHKAKLGDSSDVTALHLAAQHGHSAVVQMLIEGGAVIDAVMTVRGIDGITPLHLAVQNEHLEVMDILITAGCDVHSSTQPQDGNADKAVSPQETKSSAEENMMESLC